MTDQAAAERERIAGILKDHLDELPFFSDMWGDTESGFDDHIDEVGLIDWLRAGAPYPVPKCSACRSPLYHCRCGEPRWSPGK